MAFPQYGILDEPGHRRPAGGRRWREGVEVIGGIDPAGIDGDPVRHLDVVFGLAERPRGDGSTSTCTTAARSAPGSSA